MTPSVFIDCCQTGVFEIIDFTHASLWERLVTWGAVCIADVACSFVSEIEKAIRSWGLSPMSPVTQVHIDS